MKCASLLLVAVCASVSCGGARPTPTATIAPIPSASAAPVVHDPIARMWPIAKPDALVRVDVGGLLASPLGSRTILTGLKGVFAELGDRIPATQVRCIEDALASAKDLVAGASSEGTFAIIRYDAARFASPRACLDPAEPVDVTGAREAWKSGKMVVAVASPGLVVAGAPALVDAALRGTGNDPRALASVALRAHEYARVAVLSADSPGEGSLLLTPSDLTVRGSADFPENVARLVETGFASSRTELPAAIAKLHTGVDTAAVTRLYDALSLKRTGNHLVFAFELREGVDEQARDLGVIAALMIAGERQYLLQSKEVEARVTVHEIGRDVAAYWEREDGTPRSRKKLRSFPAVPKDVPRGTKYTSTAADWKAWAPLRFEMDTPQYYQYEIHAAKDGMSAEVIARGDLNGDGKTSSFKLPLHVERSDHSLVIAPTLVEVDPDE